MVHSVVMSARLTAASVLIVGLACRPNLQATAEAAQSAGNDGNLAVERERAVHERASSAPSALLSTSKLRKSSSKSGLSVTRPMTLWMS